MMSDGAVPLRYDASCLRRGVHAASWQEAVAAVGALLVERGFAMPEYARHMTEVIERFGPYVVIAPGIALVHARPGRDTLRNGLVAIELAAPVGFGHPHYDPVTLVLGVAVTRPEEHLSVVAAIANAIDEAGVAGRGGWPGLGADGQEAPDVTAFVEGLVARLAGVGLLSADEAA